MQDLFDLSLPRWPAPNTSVTFFDESSLGERFVVYGALYSWWPSADYKKEIAGLENKLAEIKRKHGLSTVKWKEVPPPGWRLEGYKALVSYMASLKNRTRFKCMVVDTDKYPLKNKAVTGGDRLVGYLKHYTLFLVDGIMLTQRGYFYDITIDNYSFRPNKGQDSHALGRQVEGRYLKKFQPTDPAINKRRWRNSELKTANDEDSNLIQMADLLAGAVAFCRNGGLDRTSNVSIGRKELVAVIRKSYGGLRLDKYQQPKGPFVIWNFEDPDDGGRSLTARGEVRYYP
jgi:uncharacterized protein DUF3800